MVQAQFALKGTPATGSHLYAEERVRRTHNAPAIIIAQPMDRVCLESLKRQFVTVQPVETAAKVAVGSAIRVIVLMVIVVTQIARVRVIRAH